MADPGLPPSLDAGPAVADWREQLRDRVKEIRARKVADGRNSIDAAGVDPMLEQQTAATAERLRAIRAEVAEVAEVEADVVADASFEPDLPTVEPPPVLLLPAPPEPTVVSTAAVAPAALPTIEAPLSDDVPLFQDETEVLEETPPTMSLESDGDADTDSLDAAALERLLADLEPETTLADDADRVEATPTLPAAAVSERQELDAMPIWAVEVAPDAPATPPPTTQQLPDLSSIPAGMEDVEIPAWALPRQPQPEPRPVELPDPVIVVEQEPTQVPTRAPDFHMVAEFSSSATDGEPHPTTVEIDAEDDPVDELKLALDTPIGDLAAGAAAVADKPLPATSKVPEGNPFPGLFDPQDPVVDRPDNASKRVPGVIESQWANSELPADVAKDVLEAPQRTKTRATVATAPGSSASIEGSRVPPRGLDDTAAVRDEPDGEKLEWDLDSPLDNGASDAVLSERLDPSAPVSDRIFSAVADGLVLTTIGILLSVAGASAAATPVLPFLRAAPVPFAVVWLLFAFVYGVFFVGTCGQTLGKMVMRVRVIGADRFQVGYAKATVRALWYTLAALPAFLGFLFALRDPEHRALHDRLSGTKVVKA